MSESTTTQEHLLNQDNPSVVDLQPESALKLVEEYRGKIGGMVDRADQLQRDIVEIEGRSPLLKALSVATGDYPKPQVPDPATEFRRIRSQLQRLVPAAWELARYVSSLIENTQIDAWLRIQLRLRLAEFEGLLETSLDVIHRPKK